MFTRTLTYTLPKASTPIITAAAPANLLSVHQQIEGLRSSATGFIGEESSTSSDGLQIVYVSTWASAADYNAFYTANEALINQWIAYETQYVALYDAGMTETVSGS
jgi:heme-degrading monooxygenase HmoA